MRTRKKQRQGFSLLEVIIGIALVAIAVLGLAQMFTLAIMNNLRAERIANASFLAQQQIDVMRNLTSDELTTLSSAEGVDLTGDGNPDILKDEALDINSDGQLDYRRITELQAVSSGANLQFEVRVLVFSAEQMAVSKGQLILNPMNYYVKARVNTVISR
ncbi:MAG: prepilin-type N-terminal cleavage/methylation domain-containing protein [Candidatus Aminicenantes bacterium]|nr:prepilin-type N-terminal cleavage/methylation domain-containing protein [Candidatus Aminicenantes bacterium]